MMLQFKTWDTFSKEISRIIHAKNEDEILFRVLGDSRWAAINWSPLQESSYVLELHVSGDVIAFTNETFRFNRDAARAGWELPNDKHGSYVRRLTKAEADSSYAGTLLTEFFTQVLEISILELLIKTAEDE
jgi:hypothetical protein